MPRIRSGAALNAVPPPPPTSSGAPTRTQVAGGSAGSHLAGKLASIGPRGFLYILVALELGAIALLRRTFRNHHGG